MHPATAFLLFFVFVGQQAATTAARKPFRNGKRVGRVNANDVGEASGLVASIYHTGVLWTHNDSGDGPKIYAINTQGDFLGTFHLGHADHVDYEDIAIGPGPSGNAVSSYLYVGDIGNNLGRVPRDSIQVYRTREPALDPFNSHDQSDTLTNVDTITLTYPDEAHNAETLLIDPISGDLYILTKERNKTTRIYKTDTSPARVRGDQAIELEYMGKLNFPHPTGGDVSPDGKEIILKNLNEIRYFQRSIQTDELYEALINDSSSGTKLLYNEEKSGEAIAFAGDDSGFYTLSESAGDTTVPLLFYQRVKSD